MQRSAWIFLAAIVLPSLGLAWLAVHSVRDQQVVLEHQQAIISQNATDALAKKIQAEMDQVRADFAKTAQQLLDKSPSPQALAQDFNRSLRASWPMAEIGFAVDLDGEIYSPKSGESADARTFRDENDRFLSNHENAEVYFSNSLNPFSVTQTRSANSSSDITGGLARETTLKDDDRLDMSRVNREAQKEPGAQNLPPASTPAPKMASADQARDAFRNFDENGAGPDKKSQDSAEKTNGKATPDAAPPSDIDEKAKPQAASAPSSGANASVDATVPAPQRAEKKVVPAVPSPSPVTAATAMPAPPGDTTSPTISTTSAPAPMPTEAETAPRESKVDAPVNAFQQLMKRNVIPQQMLAQASAPVSNSVPAESDFRRVIGTDTSGSLARFMENKLRLLVWSHAASASSIVFGAQLDQGRLVELLQTAFQIPELAPDSGYSRSGQTNFCVAILDDAGHPVALSKDGFVGDWKHPFVATEIGEALPHWEAALYLVDPEQISRTARTLQATFGLIVLLLVAAIVSGGTLIATDVRRQVRLAQQKTDFVSNVSHELKTPLTSIRMFAELLAEKRVPDEERQATYLRIIAAEAARLTRLINNVLDFARLERGAPPGEHRACDLVDAVRDVVDTCGPHLEAGGISFHQEIETESLPLQGDRDALAQIILNLVSNAEKYGGNDVTVRVRRQEIPSGALGCVDVLDRGPGVPAQDVKTIFEAFHRLDDSLASGIPGSGLGLTLARRMARAHGGDVTCSPRAGGGSCFTLSIPMAAVKEKD